MAVSSFGFGPDQTGHPCDGALIADGGGDSRRFTPTARQYETQRINGLPQKTVTPPPEVRRASPARPRIFIWRG
jgi:hypothetical protein